MQFILILSVRKFIILCKPSTRYRSVFAGSPRHLVSNSYKYLHNVSSPVAFLLFWLPRHYGQVCRPFRRNFSSFDRGFLPTGPLTFQRFYGIFSLAKAKTKTCVPGKILREGAVWCKAPVTLPVTIPLPSRREEMP